MPAGGRRSEAAAPSALVGSAPRLEPPVSGWGRGVRSAERCACRSGDRRSKLGAPCGGGAGRALRACGPRAGLKTGGPRRHAITPAGTFQAGSAIGVGFARPCHLAKQPYATPPAGGGLCRLKPAFQAGGAIGGGGRRALRACGPRAGLKAPTGRLASGPGRRVIAAGGTFGVGALTRECGGWWFLRSRDLGERAYGTPPAGGGLCRLKPAFQAGGAMPAWRHSGRCAL